jgi:uncharacterized protein (DUF849 family)
MKAAINGGRARAEHLAIPITPEDQAKDAAAVIAAGAGAIHVHIRGSDGRESLDPDDVATALEKIRGACRGTLVGVSTGAWIVADTRRRLSLIRGWSVLPDFASVNVHEEGAIEVIRVLLDRGVGVEAGVWNAGAATVLRRSGLAHECLRVLIEPAEEGGDAIANLAAIEAVLGPAPPSRLLHGVGASAWELVALAAERGYDTRTGLEDTLTMPRSSSRLCASSRKLACGRGTLAMTPPSRPNSTFDRTAGSHSLAAAGQRGR